MPSWIVLRKPTARSYDRVLRDRELGIPTCLNQMREPTREELETWAIQIGLDPDRYTQTWERMAKEPILAGVS
jgi:hypothetical protein